MPDQVPPPVKQERMRRLMALGEELSRQYRQRFEGCTRPVLWEEERQIQGERLWFGHSDNYLPVYARGMNLRNRVTRALIGGVYHDGVRGSIPGEAL